MLKSNTTYVNDPKHAELLQSFQTLMQNNYHGIPGAGDCDCFTIAATSCFVVSGLPCEIVLAGNVKNEPSHVYNRVKWGYKFVVFDLTNSMIGQERYYRYKNYLQIKTV